MIAGDFNWYAKHNLDVTGLGSAFHVLHVASNDDEVLSMMLRVKGRAMLYKFKDKTYNELQKISLPSPDTKSLVVFQIIENPFCFLN